MVLVKYVGSRACRADGVLWAKNDERDVTQDFYNRFKNQGFELVKKEKKKNIVKRSNFDENNEFIKNINSSINDDNNDAKKSDD